MVSPRAVSEDLAAPSLPRKECADILQKAPTTNAVVKTSPDPTFYFFIKLSCPNLGSCSSASRPVSTIQSGSLLGGFKRTSHTNAGCPKLAAFLIPKLFQLPYLSLFPKALVCSIGLCLLKKGVGFQSQCCASCALQLHLCLAPLHSGTQEAEFYCL